MIILFVKAQPAGTPPSEGERIEFKSDAHTDKGPATGVVTGVKMTVDGHYITVKFADAQESFSWDDIRPGAVNSGNLWMIKAHVDSYTKKDGTFVAAHEDKRSKHSPEQMAKWAEEKRQREQAAAEKRASNDDAAKEKSRKRADAVLESPFGKLFTPDEVSSIQQYYLSGDRHGALDEGKNAAVSAIERKLRADGVEIEHVSLSQNGGSKSLYVKIGDDVVRVSDHELPETAMRQYNRSAGRSGKWSREVVVSDWQYTSPDDYLRQIRGDDEPITKAVIFLKSRPELHITDTYTPPTQAQAAAGNYKKPRIQWHGLEIAIENPVGSVRKGYGWRTEMSNAYGYIRRTEAADGDEVDVYLGPDLDAPMVYVVHQRKYDAWDEYDEDKVMIGFGSEAAAKAAYLRHYDDPRFLGPVTAMPVADFVDKAKGTLEKPGMIKAVLFFKPQPDTASASHQPIAETAL